VAEIAESTSEFRVNQRAKAGRGKFAYGITSAKLAQLSSIRDDPASQLSANVHSLKQFTEKFIGHARALALSGQKDEARNWLRFFQNSRLLDVLQSFPAVGDLGQMRADLNALSSECHPLDVPNWTTDIEAIRAFMAEILEKLPAGVVEREFPLLACNRRHRLR
jgi:hypothetical protein